ncbi:hypothetical protein T03_12224 [Trichinella britovi]|uniref:Uncharacterized protein n=1 Tax=Trichinella britovi TaxID=45882 RepID=A0A0V1AJC0_TRIBR|nr:hypothetical protein T03_12224 [Trichinella britovi]
MEGYFEIADCQMNGTEDYGYKRECLSYEKRFSGHISVVHYTQYYCTFW